ncbi:MAG: cell division protein ZapA [Bacteroidales bacterium]
MEEIKINVKIDKKEFPVSIDREKEKLYRDAVKKLNEYVLKYKKQFAGSIDGSDTLAMVAFDFAVQIKELESKLDFDPIAKEIEAMSNAIDPYLSR